MPSFLPVHLCQLVMVDCSKHAKTTKHTAAINTNSINKHIQTLGLSHKRSQGTTCKCFPLPDMHDMYLSRKPKGGMCHPTQMREARAWCMVGGGEVAYICIYQVYMYTFIIIIYEPSINGHFVVHFGGSDIICMRIFNEASINRSRRLEEHPHESSRNNSGILHRQI